MKSPRFINKAAIDGVSKFGISGMRRRGDSLGSANPISTAETRKIGHIKFGILSADEIVSDM